MPETKVKETAQGLEIDIPGPRLGCISKVLFLFILPEIGGLIFLGLAIYELLAPDYVRYYGLMQAGERYFTLGILSFAFLFWLSISSYFTWSAFWLSAGREIIGFGKEHLTITYKVSAIEFRRKVSLDKI
ncbi:MAG: hypothetical protein ACYTHN_22650, partial [Planctomycetota bacterium]